jgi:hypothetical protein
VSTEPDSELGTPPMAGPPTIVSTCKGATLPSPHTCTVSCMGEALRKAIYGTGWFPKHAIDCYGHEMPWQDQAMKYELGLSSLPQRRQLGSRGISHFQVFRHPQV